MTLPQVRVVRTIAANNPSDYTEFASKENRIALIDHYNRLAGRPSDAMVLLQDEFINARMIEHETIAFVKVCLGLINARLMGLFPG